MTIPQTVSVTRVVDVPGRDVDRILPDLVRIRAVEGSGPGARRTCGTDQGVIEETLLTIDDDARLFRYRIDRQSMMPLTDYVGAVHVVPLEAGGSHVLWFATYQLVERGAEAAVADGLRGLLGSGIGGLAALARGVA